MKQCSLMTWYEISTGIANNKNGQIDDTLQTLNGILNQAELNMNFECLAAATIENEVVTDESQRGETGNLAAQIGENKENFPQKLFAHDRQ